MEWILPEVNRYLLRPNPMSLTGYKVYSGIGLPTVNMLESSGHKVTQGPMLQIFFLLIRFWFYLVSVYPKCPRDGGYSWCSS
jgi:hypothetical protein